MKTTTAAAMFSLAMFCTSVAAADTFGSGANTFDIEFVTIGDPGNAPDTGGPWISGDVDYTYRIGKFEISEGMVDKANTLGGLGLTHYGSGENKPATYISWFEAAIFVNWLNTDSGSTPAYKFDGDGNFQLWTPGDAGYNPSNLFRNSQATYFLPSEDEWYKAAYYDPSANDNTGGYWDYPTGSDSVPDGIDFFGDMIFDAVFDDGGFNLQPNDITDVGTLSPYGTAGQGGNVWELQETEFDLVNDSVNADRGDRGGAWDNVVENMLPPERNGVSPGDEGRSRVGFRVASISEPTPGDANGDGHVDGLDYLIWAGNYGDDPADDPPGSPGNGDYNNDNVVDGLDYLTWAGNYLQGPNDGVAVPEPGACALLVMGGLMQLSRRCKWGVGTAGTQPKFSRMG
jgi:hypothetical protein